MKKIVGGVLVCLILSVVVVNIVIPVFHKETDSVHEETISKIEFESDSISNERILCIDDNEEGLIWRLRMIENAEKSIVLATFDLRPDESGTDIMSALYIAAERGVNVKILVDGIYKPIYLNKSDTFHALCAHENVEVRFYNPLNLKNIYKVNYRMHDKYLIIDDKIYMLGGRNTNDIFLGNYQKGINIDRDILVYETELGEGESLQQLRAYFEQMWENPCVQEEVAKIEGKICQQEYARLSNRYEELRSKYEEQPNESEELRNEYENIEQYHNWEEATFEVNKITLISNEQNASNKSPQILSVIEHLAKESENILIQTPYVICNDYMYDTLKRIEETADIKIILNAVEKGSNPWGCTDYLNNKEKILNTGSDVYELMNEYAVHTKTVLIDDNISIVGSYNLDMRSTYLDTELMLVIDSKELNSHIWQIESEYMEKSIEAKADGTETKGKLYIEKELTGNKKTFYRILQVIIRPFRHLL